MDDVAIKVDSVSKSFKLPHEKANSVKSAFVGIFNGKRTYEKQKVLQKVSFDIKKGDFFGIVGRNGSGKSTLLKLLAGVYSPDNGQILVNGKLTPFIELGVGFNPELSGRENVYLNGALLGFNRNEMDAMYEEIVEFAELEKFMDQKLKNYSSGMQVRLAFSIAIRAESDILLLDEVLAVGDAAFQQKCFNYFEELRRQNRTVVFVSHDMSSVQRFCNNAIYIKDGKLVKVGTASEIANIYLEENISNQTISIKSETDESEQYRINTELIYGEDGNITLRAKYTSGDNDEVYVGLSILRDGISIAEITTSPNHKLSGAGVVSYKLETNTLNAGVYQMPVALFRSTNRELIAIPKEQNIFKVGEPDIRRGGAMKLPDNWKYGS